MKRSALIIAAAVAGAIGVGDAAAQGTSQQGACRPPARNTVTFLDTLPASAGHQVLAQVELIELVDARPPRGQAASEPQSSKVRVRVINAVKGVARGQTFVVDTGGATCDQVIPLGDLGDKAFIAGRFVTDREQRTFFVGPH